MNATYHDDKIQQCPDCGSEGIICDGTMHECSDCGHESTCPEAK